jgi:lysophospholipase L1-like esterase
MAHGAYTRYVALGDSQTEGRWDGDDSDGIVGFADRLAAMLDALHPGLWYANLATRGRRIHARGVSSGDGRGPKRPRLESLVG